MVTFQKCMGSRSIEQGCQISEFLAKGGGTPNLIPLEGKRVCTVERVSPVAPKKIIFVPKPYPLSFILRELDLLRVLLGR